MRCWTKWLEACAWGLLAWGLLGAGAAQAQIAASLQQLTLARNEEGLFLTASVVYEPAAAVAEAVARSVPLYFVAHAEVMRERWYWTDKRLASASRTYRLAYQPLTRRWRVSVASGAGPAANLQYALHQNHDSLKQALAAVTRLYGWKVADADALADGGAPYLNFQFKLDMALLPRPFQLGMNTQSDWNIDLSRTVSVPTQWTPVPVTSSWGEPEPLPAKAP